MSEISNNPPEKKRITPSVDADVVGSFPISDLDAFLRTGGKTKKDQQILELRKRMRQDLGDNQDEKQQFVNHVFVFKEPDGRISAQIVTGWGPDQKSLYETTHGGNFLDLTPEQAKIVEDLATPKGQGKKNDTIINKILERIRNPKPRQK